VKQLFLKFKTMIRVEHRQRRSKYEACAFE